MTTDIREVRSPRPIGQSDEPNDRWQDLSELYRWASQAQDKINQILKLFKTFPWNADNPAGDLVPDSNTQGIGRVVSIDPAVSEAPAHVVVASGDSLRGGLVSTTDVNGALLAVVGFREEDLLTGQATSAVRVAGSIVLLSGAAAVAIQVPQTTQPEDIEEHVVKFGQLFTHSDGNTYATLEVGPEIQYAVTETGPPDLTDYDVGDLTVANIGAMIVAETFTANALLNYVCEISEEGLRTSEFIVEALYNGVPVGFPKSIFLNGTSEIVTDNIELDLIPSISDTAEIRVTGVRGNPNAIMFVRGSDEPSQITIRQAGA